MAQGLVPQAGSLSARIIRACPEHVLCALECPARAVEDLGTVAKFEHKEGRSWRRLFRRSEKP
jgi:hypothetical protein